MNEEWKRKVKFSLNDKRNIKNEWPGGHSNNAPRQPGCPGQSSVNQTSK